MSRPPKSVTPPETVRLDTFAIVAGMKAELLRICDLEPADGAWIAAHLCRPGSEMQTEFYERLAETPVVVFSNEVPIAWVATHEWRDLQTLEAFTHPEWRRRGLARAGALMLLATWNLDRREPVAVFSPDCMPLAKSLGFVQVCQYQRSGDDWSLTFS